MRRLTFLFALVFVLPQAILQAIETDRPNILFIAVDDMNDWIGCYGGHPQVQTPNIDKLAGRGVMFTNAQCQAPICNPSRVSMLIGKLPSTTGIYFLAPGFRENETTKDDETVFQSFRKAGYHVSTCGKIFHTGADPLSFDTIQKPKGWTKGKTKIGYTLAGTHPAWDWGQVDVPDEEQRDYFTAKWSAEQIPKLAASDKPYFLAVGFHLPHVPIYASKKWFDLYPLQNVKLPRTIESDRDDLPEISKQLTQNPTGARHDWVVENNQWQHAVQSYLAANSFIDHLVGMLVKSLDDAQQAENTIIVFWSDHGFHLGEKQRWGKRTLWEETSRVPLIFAGPKIAVDQPCHRPVGLIDVYPTLLSLCGLPAREELDGLDITTLLSNPEATWEKPAISTFGPNNHSLRSERYRYTVYADGSEELYDHENDPHEWENLLIADNPKSTEHAAVIAELRNYLPTVNVDIVPGSAGSDSPLYGEGGTMTLQEAMGRAKQ